LAQRAPGALPVRTIPPGALRKQSFAILRVIASQPNLAMNTLRWMLVLMVMGVLAIPSQGQDLVERYRRARFRVMTQEFLARKGLEATPHTLEHIPSRADTVQQWLNQLSRNARIAAWNRRQKVFEIEEWRLVRRFERAWFHNKFDQTLWAYLGTEALLPLDTTYTRALRAQLEAYFGPPTQTITDLVNSGEHSEARDRFVQFEYWFVVNDSIPMVVMDVNGPLERGLIVSTDQRYRDILLAVREAFMKEFLKSSQRAPYVDYFYDARTMAWFYTGYDGSSFFMEPIGQPNLALGRPWLEILQRSD
jgi:hypothetical protein